MKYAIISNQKRSILLKRVLKQKEPIKLVAQQLKIKFPSAKSIIRTYKKTGRIFNKKKTRKAKLQFIEKKMEQKQKKDCSDQKKQIKTQNYINEKSQKQQVEIQNQLPANQADNFCPPIQAYSFVSTFIYSPYVQYSPMAFNPSYYPS